MRVWNCTEKEIEVPLADLPLGGHRLGLALYTAGKLAGEPLKESVPIADFPDKFRLRAMWKAKSISIPGSSTFGVMKSTYSFFGCTT